MKPRFGIYSVAALALAYTASGAITSYTDRSAWLSAAGPGVVTVDFENYTTDTSFAASPVNVGPFSLSTIGTASEGRNIIDADPVLFPPLPASFGNVAVDVYVEDPLQARLDFSSPSSGFFADFLYAGNGAQLQLTLSLTGGGTVDLAVPGSGTDLIPFGFISTGDSVTGIRFHNYVNDGFYLDNISVVPEPGSGLLMFFGLSGLWLLKRRPR